MKMTTLCYPERDGQYLMLYRNKKQQDENAGKWIGIGGKFENGESPEECMLREVREETGFQVTDFRYRGIITFVSDQWECEYMHLFTCSEWSGEQHECDEGELRWIQKEKLRELTMWEGDKLFLKLLEQDTPFFSLKLTYSGDKLVSYALNGKAGDKNENI